MIQRLCIRQNEDQCDEAMCMYPRINGKILLAGPLQNRVDEIQPWSNWERFYFMRIHKRIARYRPCSIQYESTSFFSAGCCCTTSQAASKASRAAVKWPSCSRHVPIHIRFSRIIRRSCFLTAIGPLMTLACTKSTMPYPEWTSSIRSAKFCNESSASL